MGMHQAGTTEEGYLKLEYCFRLRLNALVRGIFIEIYFHFGI